MPLDHRPLPVSRWVRHLYCVSAMVAYLGALVFGAARGAEPLLLVSAATPLAVGAGYLVFGLSPPRRR